MSKPTDCSEESAEQPDFKELFEEERRRRKAERRRRKKAEAILEQQQQQQQTVVPRNLGATPSNMRKNDLKGVVFPGNLALCPNLITMANLPNHYQETLEHLTSFYHGTAGELDTILTHTSEALLADMERVHLDQDDVLYPAEAPLTGLLGVHLARMFSQLNSKTESRVLPLTRPSIRLDRDRKNSQASTEPKEKKSKESKGSGANYCEPDVLICSEFGDEPFHYPVVVELGRVGAEEKKKIVAATANGVTVMQDAYFKRQPHKRLTYRTNQDQGPSELLPRPQLDEPVGALHPVLAVILRFNQKKLSTLMGTVSLLALYPRFPVDESRQFCALSVNLWDTAGVCVTLNQELFKRLLLSIALFSAPGFVQPGNFQIESNVYFHKVDGQDYCYKYFSDHPEGEYQRDHSMYLQEFSRLGAELVYPNTSADEAMQDATWHASKGRVIRYPVVQGSHIPTHASQFVPILEQLQSMHNAGFVHGDIRLSNMVFNPMHPNQSRLIDFDMAGEASTRTYPEGYTTELEDAERHEGASEFETLEKDHDLYSMGSIMKLFTCSDSSGHAKRWGKYADNPMSLVAAKTKRYRHLSLSPTKNFAKKVAKISDFLVGTRSPRQGNSPPTVKDSAPTVGDSPSAGRLGKRQRQAGVESSNKRQKHIL